MDTSESVNMVHSAQLAESSARGARLHGRERGSNEYPRQFDRLLLQDKLERGVRRGGSRSERLQSCFRGCWQGLVRHRVCGNGYFVRLLLFYGYVKAAHNSSTCVLLPVFSSFVCSFYDPSIFPR